jgi:hypothetical protein
MGILSFKWSYKKRGDEEFVLYFPAFPSIDFKL